MLRRSRPYVDASASRSRQARGDGSVDIGRGLAKFAGQIGDQTRDASVARAENGVGEADADHDDGGGQRDPVDGDCAGLVGGEGANAPNGVLAPAAIDVPFTSGRRHR